MDELAEACRGWIKDDITINLATDRSRLILYMENVQKSIFYEVKMQQVNITQLRNHLPHYLKQVQKGMEFQVTTHGKIVARLVPEESARQEAYKRLMELRGTIIQGDIIEATEGEWSAYTVIW